MTPAQIVELKITILNLYAAAKKDPNRANRAILNAAHKELFDVTGEIYSQGAFVKPATVTIGAFLDGRPVCTITARNEPRHAADAIRTLRNSYPEALICRKL